MDIKKLFFVLAILSTSILSSALYHHTGPAYSSLAYDTFDKEGSKIGLPYKLKLISSGLPTLAGATENQEFAWALLFTCPEKMDLAQSQAMAQDIASKLLEVIY